MKFFEEQRLKQLEEERRLQIQLEIFKREAAQKKAASDVSIPSILPVSHMRKQSTPILKRPKISPIAKVTPIVNSSPAQNLGRASSSTTPFLVVSTLEAGASKSSIVNAEDIIPTTKKRPPPKDDNEEESPHKKSKLK